MQQNQMKYFEMVNNKNCHSKIVGPWDEVGVSFVQRIIIQNSLAFKND